MPGCEPGNRNSKDFNEIALSIGREGLKKFVSLEFITFLVCHPKIPGDS